VQLLRSQGFACEAIWASPWTRAAQTAQSLAQLCAAPVRLHEGLCRDPRGAAGAALLEEAQLFSTQARLVLVGHDPWIAEIAALLGAGRIGPVECGELILLRREAEALWTVKRRIRAR
jgi:phosphohistidine phosphatase SixA